MLIDNSLTQPQLIAEGNAEFHEVSNDEKWLVINEIIKNDENGNKRKNT